MVISQNLSRKKIIFQYVKRFAHNSPSKLLFAYSRLSLYSHIVSYLSWREYGNVVLVDDPGLFLDELRTPLLLEVLARQPEEDVLLAVLAAEERAEHLAALWKRRK